jgi:hypothetical protein
MTRREQNIGKHGEQLARSVLSGLGLEFIEEIGTPVKLIPVRYGARRDVYQVIWGEKVAGDHRAMFPDGRSVLIEVKTVYERNLVWSDLREHQPAKLQQHADLNGLSLLVWVHHSGVYVMRWPVDGFRFGKGITPAEAAKHNDATAQYIQNCVNNCQRDLAELEREL